MAGREFEPVYQDDHRCARGQIPKRAAQLVIRAGIGHKAFWAGIYLDERHRIPTTSWVQQLAGTYDGGVNPMLQDRDDA